MLAHALIGGAEYHPGDPLHGNLQSGRRHVRPPRVERSIDFRIAAHRRHLEPHAQIVGEAASEFVFRPLRLAVRRAIEGQRAVARDHTQFPESLDLIDQAR